jgi:hypothetical protein
MKVTATPSFPACNGDITYFEVRAGFGCSSAKDVDISSVFLLGGHGAGYVLDCYVLDWDAICWFAWVLLAI